MEIFVLMVVVLALLGAIVWNKRNAALAEEGVQFRVAAPPEAVSRAVQNGHSGSVRAAAQRLLSGVTVTDVGGGSFRTDSRFGDHGVIEIRPDASGSTVHARTVELYRGSPPSLLGRGGLFGLGALIVHRVYVLIGICPSAARMKRMQQGIEGRVLKELRRTTQR